MLCLTVSTVCVGVCVCVWVYACVVHKSIISCVCVRFISLFLSNLLSSSLHFLSSLPLLFSLLFSSPLFLSTIFLSPLLSLPLFFSSSHHSKRKYSYRPHHSRLRYNWCFLPSRSCWRILSVLHTHEKGQSLVTYHLSLVTAFIGLPYYGRFEALSALRHFVLYFNVLTRYVMYILSYSIKFCSFQLLPSFHSFSLPSFLSSSFLFFLPSFLNSTLLSFLTTSIQDPLLMNRAFLDNYDLPATHVQVQVPVHGSGSNNKGFTVRDGQKDIQSSFPDVPATYSEMHTR